MWCLRIRLHQASVNARGFQQIALGLGQLARAIGRLRRMIRMRVTLHQALVNFDRAPPLPLSFRRVCLIEKLVRVAADLFFARRSIFHLFVRAKNDGRRTPLGESHAGGRE